MPISVKGENGTSIQIEALVTPGNTPDAIRYYRPTRLVDAHSDTGLTRRDNIGQPFPFARQQPTQLLYKRLW